MTKNFTFKKIGDSLIQRIYGKLFCTIEEPHFRVYKLHLICANLLMCLSNYKYLEQMD